LTSTATTVLTITPSEGRLIEADLALIHRVHGHVCPLVLMGARQAKVAAALLSARFGPGRPFAFYRGYSCALDGVQLFSGATWGNSNLVVLRGKDFSLTLTHEEAPRAVRVTPAPGLMREIRLRGEDIPGSPLQDRLVNGDASALFTADETAGAPSLSAWPGEKG
jgi:formylmethanofuran dehydrogenase subunit E